MIFITIAAVIGIDTLGAVSSSGAQVLTWLLISAVTFLLPYGLLTAELGTTFPQEGGVYVWCKMAGGSVLTNTIFRIVVALIFIWGITWSAILALRVGKWLSVIGSYAKFALIAVFTVLALAFFIGGHSTGQHVAAVDLIPHDGGLVVSLILPVLIFNWVGFELQNGAGEEMVNPQRDVPRSLIRAGIIAVIAYTIP